MSTGDSPPIIQLRDVCFAYRRLLSATDQRQTLCDINFDLYRGETLGVVGGNGAGKSTVLRLLAGVMIPSRGEILKAAEIRCSLLSLGVGFMMDLTGEDNVVLSLMLQGFSKRQALSRVSAIREFSELGSAFYERVRTYSSGMRSRLTFSTALSTDSDVLLIDEVLAVGDQEFRKKARAALNEKISGEQTVVLVSHSAEVIREVCDRTVWMHAGRVQRAGRTEVVMDAYERDFSPSL